MLTEKSPASGNEIDIFLSHFHPWLQFTLQGASILCENRGHFDGFWFNAILISAINNSRTFDNSDQSKLEIEFGF